MKNRLAAGSTSVSDVVFCRDTSNTSAVIGLTGLAYNTAGMTLYYRRQGASSDVAVSLGSATLGTWTTGGFIKIDDTNMDGQVEVGYPNAALASGATFVSFTLQGATNMETISWTVYLDAVNYQDGVRFGLSALPNASAAASGGLPTVDSSNNVHGLQTRTVSDTSVIGTSTFSAGGNVNASQIGGQTASASATITFPSTLASTTNITAGTITTVTNTTNAPTVGDFTSTMKSSLNASTPASVTGAVGSVTSIVTANVTEINGSSAVSTGGKPWVLDGSGNAVANVANQTTMLSDLSTLQTTASAAETAANTAATAATAAESAANSAETQAAAANATVTSGAASNATILAAVAALSVGGNGSNPVTITVTDTSSNPLQGASVSLWDNGTPYTATATNVDGVTSISMATATYQVNISLAGFTFAPVNLSVTGATSQMYPMTAVTIPTTSVPGKTIISGQAFSTNTSDAAGQVISIQQIAKTPAVLGGQFNADVDKSTITASDGTWSFTSAWQSTKYQFKVGGGNWQQMTTTATGASPAPPYLGNF